MKQLPETQLTWIFYGQGMASFGRHARPESRPVVMPGPGEVLAKVEAVSLCASDVKMIDMGNDYPLFKDRDFTHHPAILGHELSLSVVACGSDMVEMWPEGQRFGVQPDVYLNGERFCIGVNVTGGMAEYLLLGKEVFTSDQGCCAFAIEANISDAALAQTEPLACVEAAFVRHSRKEMKKDGRLLIWLAPGVEKTFTLDVPFNTEDITCVGQSDDFNRCTSGLPVHNRQYHPVLPQELFDDILILGNPDTETLTHLTECMAVNGLLCWLPERRPEPHVPADIAKVHYHNVSLMGSPLRRLSAALSQRDYRYDYQPGGTLVLSGGAGTMGRIHLQRALKSPHPPATVVVTGNTRKRLDRMQQDFAQLLAGQEISVHYLAVQESDNFAVQMRELVGEQGASDIIICAPGIDPLSSVIDLLANDGTLVLFSGTRYGQFGPLPLGQVAWHGATITASSGSSAADQRRVLDKVSRGEALPDFNVAAIGGLLATREGLEAVKTGKFPGKVVIYPGLHDLPLLALTELARWDQELSDHVAHHGWSREAEEMLFSNYQKKQALNH